MARYQLTEAQLRQMIQESVEQAINEGFWDNLKMGVNTFTGYSGQDSGSMIGNLKNRYKAAKNNYQLQGQWDDMNNIAQSLVQLVRSGKVDKNMTIGQFLGIQLGKKKDGGTGKLGYMDSALGRIQTSMNRNINGNFGKNA